MQGLRKQVMIQNGEIKDLRKKDHGNGNVTWKIYALEHRLFTLLLGFFLSVLVTDTDSERL